MSDPDPFTAPDLVLDCRGQSCPLPIIRLANAIGDVPDGGVIAGAATDAAARADVPAWCRMRGHDYLGERAADEGTPVYYVRRSSAPSG